ncbi:acetate--CoA ligase family protein [Rhodoligotrophos ferricapiens]|uniref:acetate--CoA ligase family protein n=1 Tax=Rhodoligotrophos ferricapiens TaxID=3069264 RepID=UPI00315CE7FC
MLNERDAKSLLKRYGITTTNPTIARSAEEAHAHVVALDGPAALKVVSSAIVHKAAVGGVVLDVSPATAAAAYERIVKAVSAAQPGAPIEGVLVEEMLPPGLEVFLGARLDAEFGPVVLVGYGGGNVERGTRPAAALAPLNEDKAGALIEEAFGKALPASAQVRLAKYLMAIAGPGGLIEREGVRELDINPVIVNGDGAVAADAVIHLADEGRRGSSADLREQIELRRARLAGLDALFDPKAIAVVGASAQPDKLGYRIIKYHQEFGFKGPIYPIHPTATEILGLKAYPSVEAIPGPVDRTYVMVKAEHVPEVLAASARKGVKVAQVLTAGFSEWSSESGGDAGKSLEREIAETLHGQSLRMVGPNCIGTFSASARMSFGSPRNCPNKPGNITFISQSGTFAGDVIRRAKIMGLPVGRVLSAGNCLDLDPIDYLLFCEDDPATQLTAFYVETIRDPALFFRIAERASKPIVMLKGGTTSQGVIAASSHTAALATDAVLWDAAVRQSGILQVDTVDALLDALLIFSAHGELRGNRLGIFGSGGGVSVTTSDAAARAGLTIPPLAEKTAASLVRFGIPGTSVANPIDIPVWGLKEGERYILEDVINLLKDDGNLDSIIVYVEMGSIMDFAESDAEGLQQLEDICDSVLRSRPGGAKVTLALRSAGDKLQDDFVREQRVRLLPEGIAVFGTTTRAVLAQDKLFRMTRRPA